MKNTFLFLSLAVILTGCKNSSTEIPENKQPLFEKKLNLILDEHYISGETDSVKRIYEEEFDSSGIAAITPSYFASKHLTFSLSQYSFSLEAAGQDSSSVLLLLHNESVNPAENTGMLLNHIPINSGSGTGIFTGQVTALFIPEFSYFHSTELIVLISNDTIKVDPAVHALSLNSFRIDKRTDIPSAASSWELHIENFFNEPVVYILEWEDNSHSSGDADVVGPGDILNFDGIKHPKKVTLFRLKY